MGARPDLLDEADQMADIAVEAEAAGGERHVARVVPVGDVDIVFGQHGAHGRAQQRGEMARQRRDQQDARLRLVDVLLEMQQRAERRHVGRFLPYRHLAIAHRDAGNAVGRAHMGQARTRDQLIGRGEVAEYRRPSRAVEPLAHRLDRNAGQCTHRPHNVGMGLIGLIKHSNPGGPGDRAGNLVLFMLQCEIIFWSTGRGDKRAAMPFCGTGKY